MAEEKNVKAEKAEKKAAKKAEKKAAKAEKKAAKKAEKKAAKAEKKAAKAEKKAAKAAKPAKKKEKSHKISGYFKDLKSEMKKITWYSAHDTIQNSIWVVIALVILTAVIGGINWGFSQIILLLGRIM